MNNPGESQRAASARSAVTAWRARGAGDKTTVREFADEWLKFINGD